MTTHSGKEFDILNPRLEDVDIHDIAWSLAHQARFCGHANQFYSIAQHSVLVAQRLAWIGPAALQLKGLLHDASEAYVSDITRSLKHTPGMAYYREVEDRLLNVIFHKFGIPSDLPAILHSVDQCVFRIEWDWLFNNINTESLTAWDFTWAEREFLWHFNHFTRSGA